MSAVILSNPRLRSSILHQRTMPGQRQTALVPFYWRPHRVFVVSYVVFATSIREWPRLLAAH
jgi:hypothetical protein